MLTIRDYEKTRLKRSHERTENYAGSLVGSFRLKTVFCSHPPTRARRDALVAMSKAAAHEGTKRKPFSPARPELQEQLIARACTLISLSEARTNSVEVRLGAPGRVGEKVAFSASC